MSEIKQRVVILGHRASATELSTELEELGLGSEIVGNVDAAVSALAHDDCRLLLIDLDAVDRDIFDELDRMCLPHVDIVVIGSDPDPEQVAHAIHFGAYDYVPKPLDKSKLDNLLEKLAQDPATEFTAPDEVPSCGAMIGASPPMQRLFRVLRKVAPTEASVFLIGESGTGKELAAAVVHDMSDRDDCPFVAVNCGAITRELMESELFGHEKGAFTGATRTHEGFFERAHRGTLFLDEITEMPADLQVKLLRVLESSQLRRVGSEKDQTIDVRIIAATNRSPDDAVRRGKLRRDLYYRLAQFPVELPPLRERGGDVLLLAKLCLERFNEASHTSVSFSREAEEHLRLHTWPGNVRELVHAVERACILADKVITPDDFPLPLTEANVPIGDYLRISVGTPLKQAERRLILATVKHLDGDKKRAADTLGVSLKTLYNRLNEYEAANSSSASTQIERAL